MSNPFHVGDTIVITDSHTDVTQGRLYNVKALQGTDHVSIIDDNDDEHDIHIDDCQRVGLAPNPHGQRTSITAVNNTEYLKQLSEDMDDLDDGDGTSYDERKANASVLSQGRFKAGDRLAYCDGTATLTSLTVTQCTATSVWFEETYSTPFNPDEFTLEYYDE